MKFIIDFPGQTCNRLWSYLDNVAWAILHKKNIYIIHWDTSIKHFDNLRKHKNVKFPFYSRLFIKIFGEKKIQILLQKVFNNKLLVKLYKHNISHRLGFIKGWEYRNSDLYHPVIKDEIIKIFSPNDYIINDILPEFLKFKNDNYFIIGVHIRRGDYKTFAEGKYYYDDDIYIKYMNQLLQLYHNKKVIFFISSNESFNEFKYKDFNILRTDSPTDIHDLYALSLCHRIIGPLSTFSRWASFIGNVPLCFIEPAQTIIQDKDFSVITSFYRFENNKEISNLTDPKDDWYYR